MSWWIFMLAVGRMVWAGWNSGACVEVDIRQSRPHNVFQPSQPGLSILNEGSRDASSAMCVDVNAWCPCFCAFRA